MIPNPVWGNSIQKIGCDFGRMLRVIVSLTVSVVVLVFLVFLSFDSEISRAIAGADLPDFALFINFFTSGVENLRFLPDLGIMDCPSFLIFLNQISDTTSTNPELFRDSPRPFLFIFPFQDRSPSPLFIPI